MSLEDIEIKAPGAEMGAAVFDGLFGEEQKQDSSQAPVEPKQSGDAQPTDQVQNESIPNEAIRFEKMREQRDAERQARADLEKRLAQAEGKLSVLEPGDSNEDTPEPTEYMSDTEKFLYNESQKLKEMMEKVTGVVDGIQTEGTKTKLQIQEEQFFENNPELKERRQEFINEMLGYLDGKPRVKEMLKAGELSIQEIYGMHKAANPKSTKVSQVSNPEKLFSGHTGSVPVGRAPDAEAAQAKRRASEILHDPNSTNKREAVEFLQKGIVNEIISILD